MSLRILATADLHVSDTAGLAGMRPTCRLTGQPLVLAHATRTLDWIADTAQREAVDVVIVAGDVYPNPRPSPACEAVVQAALARICDAGATVIVLLGNHDRPNGEGAHALEPLRSLRPGRLVVVDDFVPLALVEGDPTPRPVLDPGVLEATGAIPRLWFYPVPYPGRAAVAARVQTVAETRQLTGEGMAPAIRAQAMLAGVSRAIWPQATYVQIGHGTVAGSTWDGWQTVPLSDHPIPLDHFEAFDAGIWGHIHKRQSFEVPGRSSHDPANGGIFGYVGAPDRLTFGEEGNPAGAALYTCDGPDVRVSWRENPHARDFVTLAPADVLGADDFGGSREVVYRVKGEVSDVERQEVAAAVRRLVARGFIIADATEVPRTDRGRGGDVRVELGFEGVLDGVFAARPNLAEHADAVRARVRRFAGI